MIPEGQQTVLLEVAELRRVTEAACRTLGLTEGDAAIAADHLIEADLWGRTSHGLSIRFGALEKMMTNPDRAERWRVHRDRGSCVTVDGGLWPGYVVATRCTEIAIRRSQRWGVAAVAAFRMTHTGMLGYYVARAARANRVAVAFGNCFPLVVPSGAREPLLGTNPIAFGFPGPSHPIVADMATSQMSVGKVAVARQAGQKVPEGVLLDEKGNPTTDPDSYHGLTPLAGPKGTALGVAVQAISALLAGAPAVPDRGVDYGFLIIAADPEHFAGLDSLLGGIQCLTQRMHELPAAPGQQGARMPGERAFAEKARRLKQGIPVRREVWQHICELAAMNRKQPH